MCDRLSWIDLPDGTRIGPLTTYDLFDTEQGRGLRKQYTNPEDWVGHSALAWFYKCETNIQGCRHCECTDFSSPANFPPEIAAEIRSGKFIDITDRRLMTVDAYSGWSAAWPVLSQADAEVPKARVEWAKANAELDKARAEVPKARAELHKANAEWVKARDELDKANAEWVKARAELHKANTEVHKANAEWVKARDELHKANTELDKANAEWYKAYLSDLNEGSPAQRAFWALFADPTNRSDAWK